MPLSNGIALKLESQWAEISFGIISIVPWCLHIIII